MPRFEEIRSLDILPLQAKVRKRVGDGHADDTAKTRLAAAHFMEALGDWTRTNQARLKVENQVSAKGCDSLYFVLLHEVHLFKDLDSTVVEPALVENCMEGDGDYVAIFFFWGLYQSGWRTFGMMAKGVAIGILTLGTIVPIETSAGATVDMLLLKRNPPKVVYNNLAGADTDPTNRKKIRKYFFEVMEGLEDKP